MVAVLPVNLTSCKPLLAYSTFKQYAKLDDLQQVTFLKEQGCSSRTVDRNSNIVCPGNAYPCGANQKASEKLVYMCCNVQYGQRAGPEIVTVNNKSVHLWKTGLSTLLQMPKKVDENGPKILVQAKVTPGVPYLDTLGCDRGRFSEVLISGAAVGSANMTIRSGPIDSAEPFALRFGSGAWRALSWQTTTLDNMTTFLHDPAMTVKGTITSKNPNLWGPDAFVQVRLGSLSIEVLQRTEGTGEDALVKLDISLDGSYSKSEGITGWLSSDGPALAAETESEQCMTLARPSV